MVGDAPYSTDYIASLHETDRSAGQVPGAIYGSGYKILRSHATAYVQATEVGGTHPALVEAMGFGNTILANEVPEHRETLGDAGLYYRGSDELAVQLQKVLDDPVARGATSAIEPASGPGRCTAGTPSQTRTRPGWQGCASRRQNAHDRAGR